MKKLKPSLLLGQYRHLGTTVRAAALLLGVGLVLPAWSALTVNAGNGTVTDSTTGLVWDQCAQGLSGAGCATGTANTLDWAAALTAASTANTAAYKGFSDWCLPNKNELESIVKIGSVNPAIDSTVFPATPNEDFWTATTHASSPSNAWTVNFKTGSTTGSGNTKTNSNSVRLVRSGQSSASFDVLAMVLAAPDAPAAPAATAGNATASVSFVAPANGGSAITGYTVVSSPAGGTDSNAGSTGLTHTMTGLTNGTAYTFTVTAKNGVGTSSASAPSNSVTPTAPAVIPPTPMPAIPLLPVSINGIGFGTLPSIVDMGSGDGPTFMGQLAVLLSNEVSVPLRFIAQNANGTVTLGGYNGGNLSFMPHSFQGVDMRTNGVYPVGNWQYQVVANGQALTIAPALAHLEQLVSMFPGISASVADTGVITANMGGTIYVVQPGVQVQLNPATGQASLVLGADGLYRFTDAQGNTQVLYPAFAAPALLRSVVQSIDPAASMGIALDATASVLLGGVRYTLVPDLILGGVPADQLGQRYWPDGLDRYRMWVNIGLSQGAVLKQK